MQQSKKHLFCESYLLIFAPMFAHKVRTIFFDLDNTLFDHTTSEQMALREVVAAFPHAFQRVTAEKVLSVYHEVNSRLWQQLAAGEIDGETLKLRRFELLFERLGVNTIAPALAAQRYLDAYKRQKYYLPGADEIIAYLAPDYTLGVLSNGFSDLQERKLTRLKAASHLRYRVYSGDVGALKPSRLIFEAAQKQAACKPEELVYVGDSYESDIIGAKDAGWQAIWFNSNHDHFQDHKADARVRHLHELRDLF